MLQILHYEDFSVVDPDPYWIIIQELPASGSIHANFLQIEVKMEAKDERFKIIMNNSLTQLIKNFYR